MAAFGDLSTSAPLRSIPIGWSLGEGRWTSRARWRSTPSAGEKPTASPKSNRTTLVTEYGKRFGIPYVIVRPGYVYGPGNEAITGRVGIGTFGVFLHLGGSNPIPFTYVDNCADAIALAGLTRGVEGEVFNVVDDDLPSSRHFLRLYKQNVRRFRSLYVPHLLQLRAVLSVGAILAVVGGTTPARVQPLKMARLLEEDPVQQRQTKGTAGLESTDLHGGRTDTLFRGVPDECPTCLRLPSSGAERSRMTTPPRLEGSGDARSSGSVIASP